MAQKKKIQMGGFLNIIDLQISVVRYLSMMGRVNSWTNLVVVRSTVRTKYWAAKCFGSSMKTPLLRLGPFDRLAL